MVITLRRAAVALCAALLTCSGTTAVANAQALPLPSSSPLDELGRPTQQTADQVRAFAEQPWLPDEVSGAILSALAFFAGDNGDGGPPLPADAPTFTQFYWPTVSGDCMGEGLNSVGSALAVPGPAEIPAPGAEAGQTTFLFTALGTSPAVQQQGGMQVQWFNLNTLRSGTTELANHGINPDGPATLSGTADTGVGTVIAVVSGDVHTEDNTCSFIPTAAIIDAR
ncbi:hypothetical protein [Corynebacterium halotolerans]|uniref:Secreted protein n=1 Tax=Corynebacterium halotolerans YIM 70093 = DSM 44683 TaxID=1121362 RepID=M1NX98_9CORY|nr:hypothetical protein A605_05545 [Corynebacterium halotolerans YIM 70093 = DSM 44683]